MGSYAIAYDRMPPAAAPASAPVADFGAAAAVAVGPRVRALREAMGLSLRDLAERSGVSVPMLSQVERGRLVLVCDGRAHELAEGDCVTFDADLPHHFENPGSEPAVFLAVLSAGLRRS